MGPSRVQPCAVPCSPLQGWSCKGPTSRWVDPPGSWGRPGRTGPYAAGDGEGSTWSAPRPSGGALDGGRWRAVRQPGARPPSRRKAFGWVYSTIGRGWIQGEREGAFGGKGWACGSFPRARADPRTFPTARHLAGGSRGGDCRCASARKYPELLRGPYKIGTNALVRVQYAPTSRFLVAPRYLRRHSASNKRGSRPRRRKVRAALCESAAAHC